ncbi:MAG: sodium:solute symporter family protein [Synergistaceae bacterium]|nr:sodium:solute symporter family protein [Synergistaceae bacterium]
MTGLTGAGIILVVILVTGAGMLAGRQVKDNSDFLTGGGRAGKFITTGAIVGTLIGSQSTVGTAQLAFNYGISACWFTVGTGLGCLVLGLVYSDKLRHSGCVTQFQIISRSYGALTEKAGAILCTTGTFVSILAQNIACIGFIMTLYPNINALEASLISIILMCLYIVLGGTWGAGLGGIVKLTLVYITCSLCCVIAIFNSGGVLETFSGVENLFMTSELGRVQKIFSHDDFISRYMNLTARGVFKDLGSCAALILGILSTQTYMQFILSAKGDSEAKSSVLWGLIMVPPVGFACIFVGLFMRANYITLAEVNELASLGLNVPDIPVIAGTIQVFPAFIINHVSPLLGGIMLGTLLVTVIGGSSGLLLGISAIITEDLLQAVNFVKTHKLLFSRLIIILTLIIASVIANIFPAKAINDLGVISMTLRASVVFMPLTCALWLGKRVKGRSVLISMIMSPLAAIIGSVMNLPVEPLFTAVSVSIVCCLM